MSTVAKLGDVAPAKPLKRSDVSPEEIVWHLNLDQVESNSGQVLEEIVAPVADANNSTHWFDGRHVLYSKLRPYLNKVIVPGKQGIATTELVPMQPDPKRLDRKYLAHYLKSKKFVNWVSSQVAGAKMPRVSMKVFWGHEIPLPPLAKQKRIAAILDKADAIRRKRQAAIKLADDFLRATFLDMFGDPVTNPKGWKVKPLEDLVEFVSGGTPSKKDKDFWKGDFPWVSPKDMKKIEIGNSIDHVSETVFTKTSLKRIPSRSILIVVRGMILVHTVPVAITINPVAINQDIKAIIANKDILPEFLLWSLLSQNKYLLSKVSTAAHGTKRIEMIDLKNMHMVIPSIESQKQFCLISSRYKLVKSRIMLSTTTNNNLFNSLTQRAFQGKL